MVRWIRRCKTSLSEGKDVCSFAEKHPWVKRMQTAEADRIQSGCVLLSQTFPKRIYYCHRCCVWWFKQDDRGIIKMIEEMNQIHAESGNRYSVRISSWRIGAGNGISMRTWQFLCMRTGNCFVSGSDYAGEVILWNRDRDKLLKKIRKSVTHWKIGSSKFLPDRKEFHKEVMEDSDDHGRR